jgi:hypothetical protein
MWTLGSFAAANDEARPATRDFSVAAELLSRRKSETAVPKAKYANGTWTLSSLEA